MNWILIVNEVGGYRQKDKTVVDKIMLESHDQANPHRQVCDEDDVE